jgi:hypothetical protein
MGVSTTPPSKFTISRYLGIPLLSSLSPLERSPAGDLDIALDTIKLVDGSVHTALFEFTK